MPTGSREVRVSAAVAEELRVVIARRNVKHVDLAARAGIPKSTLSQLLKGGAAMDLDQFVRICAALDLTPGDVLNTALAAMTARAVDPTTD